MRLRVDALQRLVVRMTVDPAWAADVLSGAADVGLDDEALGWIRAVEPRAWSAERGRCAQLLGNLASEYPAAVRLAAPGVLEDFPRSEAFHRAIDSDASLPLAFGGHLLARAEAAAGDVPRLELEMARARRLRPERPACDVRLAPGVRLVELASGTLDAAAAAAIGRPVSGGGLSGTELAMLAPRPAGRWALPDIHVEPATGGVRALIERAAIGMHRADIAAFADTCGADPTDVWDLVRDLVRDGLLDPAAVDA